METIDGYTIFKVGIQSLKGKQSLKLVNNL